MYYYKEIDENGNLVCIFAYGQKPEIDDPLMIEITFEEYIEILRQIQNNTDDNSAE